MVFAPGVSPSQSNVHYTLLSQGSLERGMHSEDNTIIIWQLDASGKPLTTTTPLPIDDLATKALNAVSSGLETQYNLSTSAIADLQKSFIYALQTADTKNRQRNLTSFPGTFPSFGSKSISHDGSRLLYFVHNESTQSGQRAADLMPQVLVRDLSNPTVEEPIATLQGYTDAIMWSAFSPTNQNIIASAAWDGTYRIWDIATTPPSLLHKIKIKGDPQNWSGAFSPDGERVLLSGTDNVAIYSVSNGSLLHSLSEKQKLASWVRSVDWNPVDDSIALVNGAEVILWEPSLNKTTAVVTLVRDCKDKKDRLLDFFREFRTVEWLNADILAAKAAEDSWLVWDRRRNLKWRFTRPKGVEGELYSTECALVEREDGKKVFVSLDGDRVVREWVLE